MLGDQTKPQKCVIAGPSWSNNGGIPTVQMSISACLYFI